MVSRRSLLLTVPLAATAIAAASQRPRPRRLAALLGPIGPIDPLATARGSLADPAARISPDAAAIDAAAAAVRGFSADLYQALAGTDNVRGGNLVCSPYSVAVALAMARAGANGTTASEMDEVLHAPAPRPRALHAGLNALDQLVIAPYQSPDGDGTKQPKLALANSLWNQFDLALRPEFCDLLAGFYGAVAHPVDFHRATEQARQEINAWVGAHTADKIPQLLSPSALTALTVLVLVNAIYMKASWQYPFDPKATESADFTRDDGTTVTVPMMTSTIEAFGYQQGDGWVAVDLPFVGSQLAMAVVVPTAGTLAETEARLAGAWLTGLLGGFRRTWVQLRLPRWTFRQPAELATLLSEMGMPTAFTAWADFSGISRDTGLCIDKVVHETFVSVDEKGTEAAGATAVIITRPGGFQPIPVSADRPFLFVIHDVASGLPLFIGRVCDPTVSSAGSATRR